jgi:hypothetical protein
MEREIPLTSWNVFSRSTPSLRLPTTNRLAAVDYIRDTYGMADLLRIRNAWSGDRRRPPCGQPYTPTTATGGIESHLCGREVDPPASCHDY